MAIYIPRNTLIKNQQIDNDLDLEERNKRDKRKLKILEKVFDDMLKRRDYTIDKDQSLWLVTNDRTLEDTTKAYFSLEILERLRPVFESHYKQSGWNEVQLIGEPAGFAFYTLYIKLHLSY